MAVERVRGCGFRKLGGIYLVADEGVWLSCERFPIPLRACPTCDCRVNFARSFQWITHEMLLAYAKPCAQVDDHCPMCPLCSPSLLKNDRPSKKSGLIWIGKQHYSPESFLLEANNLGVSRRVSAIPKGLVIGKTRVFVAHKQGLNNQATMFDGAPEREDGDMVEPAVIASFVPRRIELMVDDTGKMEDEEWVQKLVEKKGVTLVRLPADDPDHRPVRKKRTRKQRVADEFGITAEELEADSDDE